MNGPAPGSAGSAAEQVSLEEPYYVPQGIELEIARAAHRDG